MRTNIKDAAPCVGLGTGTSGDNLVAVFSTGVDLELVSFAFDAWAAHGRDGAIALVVPERDCLPITAGRGRVGREPS